MYSFEIKTKIKFGEGSLEILNTIEDKKILIITDPFMITSKAVDKITEKLNNASYEIFSDIVPDPPIETIVQGIEVLKKFNPDVIIALGGGSAIDASKAIMDFSKKILDIKKIEFIAIPTTSGTGSEVTSFSVITDKQKGIKYPLVSEELLPDMAILDPDLVKTVPSKITADTGMDVLTHAIEAYVSTDASDFSDALAEKAIKLVFKYLLRAYKDGNDMEAREKIHNASCLAGMAFNQASLGINHSIAHVLGGKYHIPHGRTNALLLPHIIEYNASLSSYNNSNYTLAARKYAQIAELIGISNANTKIAVRNLISRIKKLQKELDIPTNLSQCNISSDVINKDKEEIAVLAIKDACTKTNPRIPTTDDIVTILDKLK